MIENFNIMNSLLQRHIFSQDAAGLTAAASAGIAGAAAGIGAGTAAGFAAKVTPNIPIKSLNPKMFFACE
jgi:F0F1-type ATP synthase membrane subunit c/vacuolar-type H+-ATPase subunit K